MERLDINKLELQKANKVNADNFPLENGVYIFFDKNKKIIYIGKAKVLRNRIRSYFQTKLLGKTKTMMQKAKYFTYITVSSEIESLLLEAKLIRQQKPMYNLALKDDKHPLYIRITKDKYPRILTARKIDNIKLSKKIYGPFPSSGNVKQVLRMIRRIFPFSTHKIGKRGCVHSQIGLCYPCPNVIEFKKGNDKNLLKKEYLENIKLIEKFLDGNFTSLKAKLIKDIENHSNSEEYEEAKILKERLERIEYITQSITSTEDYIKNPNLLEDIRKGEIVELCKYMGEELNNLNNIIRIECYDVAHLQGSFPTASMVTFINGVADKSLYRRFKIRRKKGNSDTDSLLEVAKRRKKNLKDWGKPDLIIVDGGKGQVSAFIKVFGNEIPIVGVAKRQETLIIPVIKNGVIEKYRQKLLKGGALHLVQRLRDEAHRFSRSYHHKLIEKQLFGDVN